MGTEWKDKKIGKNNKIRRIDTVPEINVAYGERTWTTEQSVRDIMQNPLDAQSELFMKELENAVVDGGKAQGYIEKEGEDGIKKVLDFLLALFRYKKYYATQDAVTKVESKKFLSSMAQGLPLLENFNDEEGNFNIDGLLNQTSDLSEKRPNVYFSIYDTLEKKQIGNIHYDTFSAEPMYQNLVRYKILAVKINDSGSGYDSQLTSTFLSTKKGKEYVRGMFGEGAKMSILHLLRNGAKVYKRSAFNFEDEEGNKKGRAWVLKYGTQGTKLSTKGVEYEKDDHHDTTGSSTTIILTGADKKFTRTFLENVDPRLAGLASNISEFADTEYKFPLPLSSEYHLGVNVNGNPNEQFVHGLRVPADSENGHYEAWFSYNFLDNTLIKGRDRNEIDNVLDERIKYFWANLRDRDLWRVVVEGAVTGMRRRRELADNSPELVELGNILRKNWEGDDGGVLGEENDGKDLLEMQREIDLMFIEILKLEDLSEPHVIISQYEEDDVENSFWVIRREVEARGYKSIVIKNAPWGMAEFVERHKDKYPIHSYGSIHKEMMAKERVVEEHVETEEEIAHKERLAKIFLVVAEKCNEVAVKAGLPKKDFEVEHEKSEKINQPEFHTPLYIYGKYVKITPGLFDVEASQEEIQTVMQKFLWGAWSADIGEGGTDYETRRDNERRNSLRESQRVLDHILVTQAKTASSVYSALPEDIQYEPGNEIIERYLAVAKKELGIDREEDLFSYYCYMKATSSEVTLSDIENIEREILKQLPKEKGGHLLDKIHTKVFIENGKLCKYSKAEKTWKQIELGEPVGHWKDQYPVYKIPEEGYSEEYFVHATFRNSSVLRTGEVKDREYYYLDNGHIFNIGKSHCSYEEDRYSRGFNVHPDGIYVSADRRGSWQDKLSEYVYDDGGVKAFSEKISFGLKRTEFSLESVQGEWLKPVRIFQDLLQNHADAVEKKEDVGESFYVEKNGVRLDDPISKEVLIKDKKNEYKIIGYKIFDKGDGYLSGDIATMGASGKAHPLRAGKYGEGRIMTTASILTSGLGLTFESLGEEDGKKVSWKADALVSVKEVVKGGKKFSIPYAAYSVSQRENNENYTSATHVFLPQDASDQAKSTWSDWLETIDPRKQNTQKHSGLARYARALREPGIEKVSKVGSFELLLDEPNAIYENGLRISHESEEGRGLPLGIDCPEIVTTRERNSYNKERLKHYYAHVLGHTDDIDAIKSILHFVAEKSGKLGVVGFDDVFRLNFNASPIWAEQARKIWPNKFVISNEDLNDQMRPPMYDDGDDYYFIERFRKAAKILAQVPHFDPNQLLDVPRNSISGFEKMLPSFREAVEKMIEDSEVSVEPRILKLIADAIAQGVPRVVSAVERLQAKGVKVSVKAEEKDIWGLAENIINNQKLGISKLDSGYHGRAGEKMVLNEMLLDPENRSQLAHTIEHELIHLLIDEADYTELFVSVLEELLVI